MKVITSALSSAVAVIAASVFAALTVVGGTPFAYAQNADGAGAGAEAAHRWLTPVPGLQIVRAFDKPEQNWKAGHRGIDVAAAVGEPIRSPATGTVRFAGKVAGKPVVSLEVGGYAVSFEPVGATVRKGDQVAAGQVIGTVADASHCSEGCVHVGVWRLDQAKDYLNPADFFVSDASILLPEGQAPDRLPAAEQGGSVAKSGAGAWGGYSNGQIPAVALCPLRSAPGHRLRCDAAKSFDALSAAFAQRFGHPISVTDSYRDYQTQVALKRRKGKWAATPGRSNHGWALAVDLGSGINRFGTPQHQWMKSNAARFGWVHPPWAEPSGSLPEPWHWEFRNTGK